MIRPVLAACALALLPAGVQARPLETRDLTDRCIARAVAQGYPRPVYVNSANRQAGNGAIFAQDVTLRSMNGGAENVICRHDVARGTLAIMGTVEAGRDLEAIRPGDGGGGGGGDGSPSFQTSAAACTQSADRKGYRVERVVNQTNIRRNGRVVARLVEINARRDGRDWRLDCTYSFADRATRIEERRR